MKKLYPFLFALMSGATVQAQEPFLPDTFALENIIVEKYYETNATDAAASLGALPEGSVTYRIYADLKPDYSVSALVGLTSPTDHPLTVSVTNNGQFYNNAFGVSLGTELSPLFFTIDELVALDSYITIGAASSEHFGVVKVEDMDGESLLGASATNVLQNQEGVQCPPALTEEDGLLASENLPALNTVGIPSSEIQKLQTTVSEGAFTIIDGSLFDPESVLGPTDENRVLLGQFTTIGGLLEFSINIVVLIPEELQCDVIPACQKSSITFTAVFAEGDSEYNQDPTSNNVNYQRDECNYSDDGSVCTIVGTEETDVLLNAFEFFPNPADEKVYLKFLEGLEEVEYALFDASGRMVMSATVGRVSASSVFEIDTRRMVPGLYVLKVRSGDVASSKKVVLK